MATKKPTSNKKCPELHDLEVGAAEDVKGGMLTMRLPGFAGLPKKEPVGGVTRAVPGTDPRIEAGPPIRRRP